MTDFCYSIQAISKFFDEDGMKKVGVYIVLDKKEQLNQPHLYRNTDKNYRSKRKNHPISLQVILDCLKIQYLPFLGIKSSRFNNSHANQTMNLRNLKQECMIGYHITSFGINFLVDSYQSLETIIIGL